jgi:hypothetical protein
MRTEYKLNSVLRILSMRGKIVICNFLDNGQIEFVFLQNFYYLNIWKTTKEQNSVCL